MWDSPPRRVGEERQSTAIISLEGGGGFRRTSVQYSTAGRPRALSAVCPAELDCKDGLATPRTAEILRCGFIIDVHRFALCRSAGPVIFRSPRLSDPPRFENRVLAVARRPAARRSKPVAGRGHRLSVSRPRRRPQLSSGSATPSGTPRLLMSDEGFLSVDMHVCYTCVSRLPRLTNSELATSLFLAGWILSRT